MAKRLLVLVLVCLASVASWYWLSDDDPLTERTVWYQMIWQGENVGYMQEESVIEGERYAVRSETRVKTISQGQPFGFRESKHLIFSTTPPYGLIKSYYRYEAPGQLIETKLDNIGNSLIGSRQENHQLTNISLPFANLTLSRFRTINDWIKGRPSENEQLTVLLPEIARAEVIETIYEVQQITDDRFKLSYKSANQQNQRQIELNEAGDILAYRFGDVIQLEMVPAKDDLVLAGDVDLYRSKLLALDKPLGDTTVISTLDLHMDQWFMEFISLDNRQQLSGNTLTLSADVSAIPGKAPNPDSSLNFQPETRSKLQAMANVATQGRATSLEQLTALREYVSDFMSDGARVSVTSIESLLENPEGDCTEHTQLFNALASTLGFHARTVNGLVYLGDDQRGFAGHQWSEVFVDGHWISFDPTWNINSLTATHIRLDQEKAASLYRYIKTANKPGLRLVSKK